MTKNNKRLDYFSQKCIWGVQRFLPQAAKSHHKKMKMALRKIFISSKENAPTLLKLGVGLDQMYTKGWIVFGPSV